MTASASSWVCRGGGWNVASGMDPTFWLLALTRTRVALRNMMGHSANESGTGLQRLHSCGKKAGLVSMGSVGCNAQLAGQNQMFVVVWR